MQKEGMLFLVEDESEDEIQHEVSDEWNILIVDDDEEIHTVTRLALSDLIIFDRKLAFHGVHSGKEAIEFLSKHDDIAVVLLDVVMEEDDSGLQVVRAMREMLKLHSTRIILRTGQPGYAPEEHIIAEYDINDYKTKTELTRKKLANSLIAAIRSYTQIKSLEYGRKGLKDIIAASTELMDKQSVGLFADGVLTHIHSMFKFSPNALFCSAVKEIIDEEELPSGNFVVSASGKYKPFRDIKLDQVDDASVVNQVTLCLQQHEHIFTEFDVTLYLKGNNTAAAIYFDKSVVLEETELQLLQVFLANISIGYDNVNHIQQLSHAAYTDRLTKLANRTEVVNLLDQYMRNQIEGDIFVLIDIDHFSDINDGLGHDVGNLLLLALVKRLRESVAEGGIIARVGPDVFAIIGEEEQLTPQFFFQLTQEPFKAGEHYLQLNLSIGFCRKENSSRSGLSILKQTNIALNRAKKDIHKNYEYYSLEMEEETAWRLGVIRQLRQDFSQRKLQLWYQPQISLASKKVIGVEALLRWPTEDGSYISPAVFVPLAEYSGLIVKIGEWVVEEACKEVKHLDALGFNDIRISVNVSMPQFRSANFVPRVMEILEHHDVPKHRIELEITESVVMDEPDMVISALQQLKATGMSVAIDDFGTGFSSLSYLQQLPLDRIKVDRAFVKDIENPKGGDILAKTVIELGKKLGLHTIAEGVETEVQEKRLRDMGCEEVQGFMYAKPMPSQELKSFLLARKKSDEEEGN